MHFNYSNCHSTVVSKDGNQQEDGKIWPSVNHKKFVSLSYNVKHPLRKRHVSWGKMNLYHTRTVKLCSLCTEWSAAYDLPQPAWNFLKSSWPFECCNRAQSLTISCDLVRFSSHCHLVIIWDWCIKSWDHFDWHGWTESGLSCCSIMWYLKLQNLTTKINSMRHWGSSLTCLSTRSIDPFVKRK